MAQAEKKIVELQLQLQKKDTLIKTLKHEASTRPHFKADAGTVQRLTLEVEEAHATVSKLQSHLSKLSGGKTKQVRSMCALDCPDSS
jgi:hypothetical protein